MVMISIIYLSEPDLWKCIIEESVKNELKNVKQKQAYATTQEGMKSSPSRRGRPNRENTNISVKSVRMKAIEFVFNIHDYKFETNLERQLVYVQYKKANNPNSYR